MGIYDDMIHLPHPVSKTHPQMSLSERAAQFSPFRALTGYGDAIHETARLTDEFFELDETGKAKLDRRLKLLLSRKEERPEAEITYFLPDTRKSGGAYVTVTGRIRKLDSDGRNLVMESGEILPLETIVEIESRLFDRMPEG